MQSMAPKVVVAITWLPVGIGINEISILTILGNIISTSTIYHNIISILPILGNIKLISTLLGNIISIAKILGVTPGHAVQGIIIIQFMIQ